MGNRLERDPTKSMFSNLVGSMLKRISGDVGALSFSEFGRWIVSLLDLEWMFKVD